MEDLTLLYYTSNKIDNTVATNVREHLLKINNNKYPIISVSQKPIDFGENICVGEIGVSSYNLYKQILIGAQNVKTKYIACCEDDALYTMEHFSFRPPDEKTFLYNINMWFAEDIQFWHKNETGMLTCICPTSYLIETLEARFKKFPSQIQGKDKEVYRYFQEPGKFDRNFGIPNANFAYFETKIPIPVFNYRGSLHGKAGAKNVPRVFANPLDGWGDSITLWNKFWGTNYDKKFLRYMSDIPSSVLLKKYRETLAK